jgi:hypothetical protein
MAPDERCVARLTGPPVCAEAAGGVATLSTVQPFPAERIVVPWAAGGLQRVRLRGGVVQPRALERSLTGHSTPGVTTGERRRLDRTLDGRLRPPPGGALYVRPEHLPPEGLQARVAVRAARAGLAPLAALGALLGLGVLGLVYRRLESGARRERIDRWFAEQEH